jgi:hypothetical protein
MLYFCFFFDEITEEKDFKGDTLVLTFGETTGDLTTSVCSFVISKCQDLGIG